MKNRFAIVAVVCSLALSAVAAEKKEPTLKPGDSAPKLVASKWVKKGPVESLEKGKVYVMEFWATWCGPCIAAIPHVTELQHKYKDKGLVVIGMNIWERDAAAVEPFVAKMGDKMDYAVAMDEGVGQTGTMAKTWMAAAGKNGIPCSFIVDREGKVAWIGHPMQMERVLGQVLDGKFDQEKEAAFQKQMDALNAQYAEAAKAKDWDKAIEALDKQNELDPSMKPYRQISKLRMLYTKGDYAAGNALAAEIAKTADTRLAMGLVQTMLLTADNTKIDADLAVKTIAAAVDKNPDAGVMEYALAARAYAAKKDYAKAAEYQQKAADKAEGKAREVALKTLEEYKKRAAGEPK